MTADRKKKRTRVALMLCIFMCALCVLIVGLILHNFVFVIEEINVTGNTRYDNADIIVSSGIVLSEPMYSIDKNEIKERIKHDYPYIDQVSVKRDLPTKLNIILTESEPSCYAELFGEYFILSDELRVLEYSDDNSITGMLPEVILPDVKRAMLTENVEFAGEVDADYIKDVLAAVSECEFADKLEIFCLASKFDIYVIYDGLYRIELGSSKDVALKLEVAGAIINSGKLEKGTKAVIDVSDPAEGTVMADKNLELVPERQ